MNVHNNTVLITGGSSGIGLELAKRLIALGNKVIICSRSEEKLKAAKAALPDVVTCTCDIASQKSCDELIESIKGTHPDLNVLVNNAAITHHTDFIDDPQILEKAEAEFETNFLGPLRLIKGLYPLISANNNPTLINVTTGLVYAPRAHYPIYNSTKAALHSFTQVLRIQLADTHVRVIEVLYPVVDTPWHTTPPPSIAISAQEAVQGMLDGLKSGKDEIRVGGARLLYALSRIAPNLALKKINSL